MVSHCVALIGIHAQSLDLPDPIVVGMQVSVCKGLVQAFAEIWQYFHAKNVQNGSTMIPDRSLSSQCNYLQLADGKVPELPMPVLPPYSIVHVESVELCHFDRSIVLRKCVGVTDFRDDKGNGGRW